jgi:chromosome segregation ATPase
MTTFGGTVLTRILARLAGQDLRRDMAQVLHQQRMTLIGQTSASRRLILVLNRLTCLENTVSELDSTTEEIVSAVNDLITAVGTGPEALATALAEIQAKNEQIAALQADDDADAEQIASLTAERDAQLADAAENVAKLQEATDRARAVVPAAEPVTDMETPPADPQG